MALTGRLPYGQSSGALSHVDRMALTSPPIAYNNTVDRDSDDNCKKRSDDWCSLCANSNNHNTSSLPVLLLFLRLLSSIIPPLMRFLIRTQMIAGGLPLRQSTP